jgi:hypothetical protein
MNGQFLRALPDEEVSAAQENSPQILVMRDEMGNAVSAPGHPCTDTVSFGSLCFSCAAGGMYEGWICAQVLPMVADVWTKSGLLAKADSPFVRGAVAALKNSLELVVDADEQLREILAYPLEATIASDEKAQPLLEDNFAEVLFFVGLGCAPLPVSFKSNLSIFRLHVEDYSGFSAAR